MATTNVSIRMDETLKKQAEIVFSEMGMNMTTAFTIFTKAVVRSGKIPFEISIDPFYSERNIAAINEAAEQIERGQVVVKTMDELRAMEDE